MLLEPSHPHPEIGLLTKSAREPIPESDFGVVLWASDLLDKGMTDFLLYASVVFLFLVSVLVVLVILMQRPSANAGMGSALGGGAAESVFGGESANVLSKMTTTLTVILFILSFGLYLGFVARENKGSKALAPVPTVTKPVKPEPVKAPVSATTAPTTPVTPVTPTATSTTPAAPANNSVTTPATAPVKSEPVPAAPAAPGTKQ